MRAIILGFVVALGLVRPLMAADADEAAIRNVIQSQVDAFVHQDAVTAFSFASPMIQGIFGSPENFGRMVQSGYPAIWNPSRTQFLGLRTEGGRTLQRMLFAGPDGHIAVFDYEMTQGPDGWRINGVYPVEGPSVGA